MEDHLATFIEKKEESLVDNIRVDVSNDGCKDLQTKTIHKKERVCNSQDKIDAYGEESVGLPV